MTQDYTAEGETLTAAKSAAVAKEAEMHAADWWMTRATVARKDGSTFKIHMQFVRI